MRRFRLREGNTLEGRHHWRPEYPLEDCVPWEGHEDRHSTHEGRQTCAEEKGTASLAVSAVVFLRRSGLTIDEAVTEFGLLMQ